MIRTKSTKSSQVRVCVRNPSHNPVQEQVFSKTCKHSILLLAKYKLLNRKVMETLSNNCLTLIRVKRACLAKHVFSEKFGTWIIIIACTTVRK